MCSDLWICGPLRRKCILLFVQNVLWVSVRSNWFVVSLNSIVSPGFFLHSLFTFQMISPFQVPPPHKPSSLCPFPNNPPLTSLSWYSPALLHQAFLVPGPSPSFFLGIIWYVNCDLGIQNFWANIHLSVITFHVCSFVIGLPHLGWYFPVSTICLRISQIHCF